MYVQHTSFYLLFMLYVCSKYSKILCCYFYVRFILRILISCFNLFFFFHNVSSQLNIFLFKNLFYNVFNWFFFSENVLIFANFRPNWQHWAKDNSKTTCPIFDFLTPFYTYLLGLQKTVKSLVSKLHSLLTICCTIWKRQKFQNIIAYNHATSHRTVLAHHCNPPLFWFSYKS